MLARQGKGNNAPRRLRKLTNPGERSLPSSAKGDVCLADQTANSFKNSLMAYRADVGGKLRRWAAGMEKRPEFTDRLVMIHQLRWEAQTRGVRGASSGVGEVMTGRALVGPPPTALSSRDGGAETQAWPSLPSTRFMESDSPRPPEAMWLGRRVPEPGARETGGVGGNPTNGMLGFKTHFLWALSFLALVLFFRAWSASTAGERDG